MFFFFIYEGKRGHHWSFLRVSRRVLAKSFGGRCYRNDLCLIFSAFLLNANSFHWSNCLNGRLLSLLSTYHFFFFLLVRYYRQNLQQRGGEKQEAILEGIATVFLHVHIQPQVLTTTKNP